MRRSSSGQLGYLTFEPVVIQSAPTYAPPSPWSTPPLAAIRGDIIPGTFGGHHARPRVLVTATAIAGLACVAVGFLVFRKAPPGLTAPASLGPLSRLPDSLMSPAQAGLNDRFKANGARDTTNALYAPPGASGPVLFIQAARSSARTDNVQGLRNAAVFGQLFPGSQGTFAVSNPSVGGVTYTCLTVVANTREVTCIWQGHDGVLSGVGVDLGVDETVALTSAARAGMHLGQ